MQLVHRRQRSRIRTAIHDGRRVRAVSHIPTHSTTASAPACEQESHPRFAIALARVPRGEEQPSLIGARPTAFGFAVWLGIVVEVVIAVPKYDQRIGAPPSDLVVHTLIARAGPESPLRGVARKFGDSAVVLDLEARDWTDDAKTVGRLARGDAK